MDIEISFLEGACKDLLKYLRKIVRKQGRVEIPHDDYWDIPFPQRYTITNNNPAKTIPSLKGDRQKLEKMLGTPSLIQPEGLVWLSSLLRAIGDDPDGVVSRAGITPPSGRVPKTAAAIKNKKKTP